MKIGIEVEGSYKGLVTVFVDAHEVEILEGKLKDLALGDRPVEHVYISDLGNTLDLSYVSSLFQGLLITVERTSVPEGLANTQNIIGLSIMLSSPTYVEVAKLRPWCDQVKFNDGQSVIVLPMAGAVYTQPEDFEGDIQL